MKEFFGFVLNVSSKTFYMPLIQRCFIIITVYCNKKLHITNLKQLAAMFKFLKINN